MATILKQLFFLKRTFKKNLWWIIILSIILGGLKAYTTYLIRPKYVSYSKIFPLSTDGGGGAASSIKAQLGIQGDGVDASKYFNVNELINSRTLSRKIVTYPTNNLKYKNLYTWLIEDYNYGLPFYVPKNKLSSDSLENIITASGIFKSNMEIKIEKNEFTSIKYKANNTELALRMNECIIQVLSDFYIESKTIKSKSDLLQIGALKDSLKYTLEQLEKASAGFDDASRYISQNISNLPKLKQKRIYDEVSEQYRAASTTYQNANYKLMYESPIFQILDKPIAPVEIIQESWKNAFLLYFCLGFIIFTLISFRKLIFNFIIEELSSTD